MTKLAAIARTGLAAVLLHPLRSATTLVCLLAILVPYAAGTGLARGLLDQAEVSIREGADLYVAGRRFGRPAPLPLSARGQIEAVPGVRAVVPRIVGEVVLGLDRLSAVVVGLPADRLPVSTRCVAGRLFQEGPAPELVLGADLARRLHLGVGSRVPPFYRSAAGDKVSTVVGVFRADLPLWEANLIFCSFETASAIFDQRDLATSFLVDCAPGLRPVVKSAILRLDGLGGSDPHGSIAATVSTREELQSFLPSALRHLDGIFQLHFVLAFAVGIPLLMVASGVGLTERRREAALLKATGWMTDELLLRGAVESLLLSLLGWSLAILLAWVWLVPGNGRGLTGIFLPGADPSVLFRVPFRLLPAPAFLAFAASFAMVATGTLLSTWRAATAAPALALR